MPAVSLLATTSWRDVPRLHPSRRCTPLATALCQQGLVRFSPTGAYGERFAAHDSPKHLDVFQLIGRRDFERIAVKNGEIGELARLDRAFLVILPKQVGRSESHRVQRLRNGNTFTLAEDPPRHGFARRRRPHRK